MSNANDIIAKAKALQGTDSSKPQDQQRTGAWAEVEVFQDKGSGLAVVIREKIRGRPSYSISFVHYDEQGPNRYIPYPLDVSRPMFEVVYLLMKQAEEFMDARPLRTHKPKDKDKHKGKGKGKGKDRKERKDAPGGLSDVARRDAETKGKPFKGKSERKREKKQQATGDSPQ